MGGNIVSIQHSLNAGEVSDRYDARQDQNKRQAALFRAINWQALTVGGVIRRSGSIFVAFCKTVSGHPVHRLFEFRAAQDAAYIMEFGQEYVRFFRNGLPIFSTGTTPFELTTVWNDTNLAELYPCQSIDVLYLCHRLFPTQKIVRTDPTTFTIVPVVFSSPPTIEEEPRGVDLGGGTLTPGATTGNGVTFTASTGAPFIVSDVGRLILAGAGRALIKTRVSGTQVTADIIDPFASTSPIAATGWRLKLSPQTTLDPENGKREEGEVMEFDAAIAAFRAADAGKWIFIFGGLVKVDQVLSATKVRTTVITQLKDIPLPTSAPADPTPVWTLEVAAWSSTLGYPSCAAFYDGRLWMFKGITIYGSVVNDFENFAKGSEDQDSIVRSISDDDIDTIVWAKGLADALIVGTGSGAFSIRPSKDGEGLTPTSFKVTPISARASARIPPIRVGALIHYVQLGQRKFRELVFDFATDKYKSPNLFQLAEHLTEAFYLTEIKYASEPDSIIYAMRSDGTLLALVYQDEESVIGWARFTTQGNYRSVAVIPRPSTGKDWVWSIVSRETGDCVEYFEPDMQNPGREWNSVQTDSAVFVAPDQNFLVTLPDHHLDGLTVRVIGDGLLYDDAVVSNAGFTLSPQIPCAKIEVGLNYESDGLTLEPIIAPEMGGPFIARSYVQIGARVRRTLGMELNGTKIPHRRPNHPMDRQVPLQSGKISTRNLGYDAFGRISFKQTVPFPAEVNGILGLLHIGDRWCAETQDAGGDAFVFIGGTTTADMFTVNLVIASDRVDLNIYRALREAGWNEISPVTYTLVINPGVTLRASAPGAFALDTGGPLPAGSVEPVWTNLGTIQGAAGAGGDGGFGGEGFPAQAGQVGGDAIRLDYDVTIDNAAGFIYGGPGGGGGGGGGSIK